MLNSQEPYPFTDAQKERVGHWQEELIDHGLYLKVTRSRDDTKPICTIYGQRRAIMSWAGDTVTFATYPEPLSVAALAACVNVMKKAEQFF